MHETKTLSLTFSSSFASSSSPSLFKIEHLYGLTVFENYLYATNSDNANMQPKTSVIRVNRFNSTDYQVVTRVDKGGALHVYHQRRQPPGALHTDIRPHACLLHS